MVYCTSLHKHKWKNSEFDIGEGYISTQHSCYTCKKCYTYHLQTAEDAVQVLTNQPSSNHQQEICRHHPHDPAQHIPLLSQPNGHPNSQWDEFSEAHLPIWVGHCHQQNEFLVAAVLGGATRKTLHLSSYHIHKMVKIYVDKLSFKNLLSWKKWHQTRAVEWE